MPTDPRQRDRFVTGKQVIHVCRTWQAPFKRLLVEALEAGCELRRTDSQHVRIDNDLGMTTTVANGGNRKGNRSLRKYQNDVAKIIEGQKMATAAENGQDFNNPPDVTGQPNAKPVYMEATASDQWLCGFHDPVLMFTTEKELAEHRQAHHIQCPKCGDWIKNKMGIGGHTSIKHGTSRPMDHRKSVIAKAAREAAERAKTGVTPAEVSARPATPKPHAPKPGSVGELLTKAGAAAAAAAKAGKPPVEMFEAASKAATEAARPTIEAAKKISEAASASVSARPPVQVGPSVPVAETGAEAVLARVREALGADPRIHDLEVERDHWKKRAEDAEAQLSIMKGLADQIRQAAEL